MERVCCTRQVVGVRDIAIQDPKLSPDGALEIWLLSERVCVATLNPVESNYAGSLVAATIQEQ